MKTLEIGQQGKLGKEVLTVVSVSGETFKCDNGKTYLVEKAFWMTNPTETVEKPKAAKKTVRELTEEEEERLAYLKYTGNDMESLMRKSTANYRAEKSGLSSLTK